MAGYALQALAGFITEGDVVGEIRVGEITVTDEVVGRLEKLNGMMFDEFEMSDKTVRLTVIDIVEGTLSPPRGPVGSEDVVFENASFVVMLDPETGAEHQAVYSHEDVAFLIGETAKLGPAERFSSAS